MAEIKIYLTLIGEELSIDHVTKRVGIAPAYVRDKNEILGNGRLFGHYEWGIETELIHTDDIADYPDKFISTIPCGPDVLAGIAKECDAHWHIMILVNVYDDFPALYFSSEFIKTAGEIGAEIGFDVYMNTD